MLVYCMLFGPDLPIGASGAVELARGGRQRKN